MFRELVTTAFAASNYDYRPQTKICVFQDAHEDTRSWCTLTCRDGIAFGMQIFERTMTC